MNTAMEKRVIEFVRASLPASQVVVQTRLQALWGGQGVLLRLQTDVPEQASVIVKCIAPSADTAHPRGWNTSRSLQRKRRSYEIECHWYEHYAQRCSSVCKVPRLLGIERDEAYSLILLEDLAGAYPVLQDRLTVAQVELCLRWLAEFHALFLHDPGEGLWPQGCYWHLQTRPDEWQAMAEGALRDAAGALDERLRNARFRTLVHGDAKVANFCFSRDMRTVSAVDFQYVGKGCGMSDVVYLLGSCLSEADCRQHEQALLDSYFGHLGRSLTKHGKHPAMAQQGPAEEAIASLAEAVETEWRSLFAIAWADFHRFLLGWMPSHDKINPYTQALVAQALAQLSPAESSS